MYGAILGFQKRVWWPKWTPASSNNFIEILAIFQTPLFCVFFRHPHLLNRLHFPRNAHASQSGNVWNSRGNNTKIVNNQEKRNNRVLAELDNFGLKMMDLCTAIHQSTASLLHPRSAWTLHPRWFILYGTALPQSNLRKISFFTRLLMINRRRRSSYRYEYF